MKKTRFMLSIILVFTIHSNRVNAQNGFLTFSNTSNATSATAGNTGFSGVRTGSGGGGWTIANPGQEIGTQAELKGIASSSASINSVGVASSEYGTAAQIFTVSFDVYFTGGSSGTWYFFAGNGASFAAAQTTSFTSNQVFTGLRFVYGSSGGITTNFRNSSGTWTATGISGTPFAQDVAYTVTVVGNNTGSTVNYGASQSLASNAFDLWVNGILAGNDLSKCQLANTTDINAFRFYGENSTSNVATICIDNVKWWNTCEPPAISVFAATSSIPANTYSDIFVNNGSASLAGNVTVNNNLYYTTGTVNLNSQTLSYSSGATLTFTPSTVAAATDHAIFPASNGPANLVINNSNGVTLHAARTLTGTLTLTSGALLGSSSNSISYATLSGGSATSYVQGAQIFTTSSTSTVTFYCGKSGESRQVELTPSGTNATTWTIEYFRADPGTAIGNSLGGGINNISTQEYFQIDRSGATPANATVKLSFENSSLVSNLTDLRIVRWNGSQWADHGNGGTTGTTSSGTIVTSAAVTGFSSFTLGSSAATNPLPVTFLYLNSSWGTGNARILEWATGAELTNQRFEVERSSDAKEWLKIGSVAGSGTTNQTKIYRFVDGEPMDAQVFYYRIKQVDFDGNFDFSPITGISLNTSETYASVKANAAVKDELELILSKNRKAPVLFHILSAEGKTLATGRLHQTQSAIPVSYLAPGIYLLLLVDGTKVITSRFIKN